jgi:uncharacterized protein with GYD domain
MPIFVALGKATDEGVRNMEAFALRHAHAVQRAQDAGAKVMGTYALMGRYDYLVILECPDEKIALSVLTREASGGNVRYETMPAMPMDEFAALVQT